VRRWSDGRIEQMMGTLLRTGVLVAAAVVLVGGILYLVDEGGTAPAFGVFHGEPSELRSLAGIVRDAAALRARGITQLGLLLLIVTPIARVAFSLVAFVLQGDLVYVAVTVTVLSVLTYRLTGGLP
jgi:uncharacterized membrane protein